MICDQGERMKKVTSWHDKKMHKVQMWLIVKIKY